MLRRWRPLQAVLGAFVRPGLRSSSGIFPPTSFVLLGGGGVACFIQDHPQIDQHFMDYYKLNNSCEKQNQIVCINVYRFNICVIFFSGARHKTVCMLFS